MFCEIRCFAGRMSIGLDVRSHLPDPSGPPVWSTLSRPDRPLFDRCAIARASSPRPFVETDFRPGLSAGKEREQPLVISFCCSALHHFTLETSAPVFKLVAEPGQSWLHCATPQ